MKKYRFFYHYFRQKRKMSIHWRGSCTVVRDVQCNVPCETKFNKRQPFLVMQGFASNVVFKKDLAIIN